MRMYYPPAIEKAGLAPLKVDEIVGVKPITEDIAKCIIDADVIVADVTDKNPNVNYELGMAHALGKQVVIITQNIDDVPFDYKALRVIIYKIDKNNIWISKLKRQITQTIKKLLTDQSSHFILKPISEHIHITQIEKDWGLSFVYQSRQEMNIKANSLYGELKNQLDIVAFGLKSFRDSQTTIIKKKVKAGLKIRILTLNPNSKFVTQREKDEKVILNSIKKTINDLSDWMNNLKSFASNPSDIQLKFYDALPLDFYWRQENNLFVGPYLYGKGSQQTITFEFKNPSKGFDYYTDYFETIWNDNEFCSFDYHEIASNKT